MKKELRLLMLGLDRVGKETILCKLKRGAVVSSVPTIGFGIEMVEYKNTVIYWDVGTLVRPLWRHYYSHRQGIIFVVDASDRERIEYAKEELQLLLHEDGLKDAALLVFANKQDLSGAISATEVAEKLDLVIFRVLLQ